MKKELNVGETVGKYTILDVIVTSDNKVFYKCQCVDCGYMCVLDYYQIITSKPNTRCRHNFWPNTELCLKYHYMLYHCNPNTTRSKDKSYREKNITVCEEWQKQSWKFAEWAVNAGYEPGYFLSRIDKTKGFCPENCEWTPKRPLRSRNVPDHYLTVNGTTDIDTGWDKRLDLPERTIERYCKWNGAEAAGWLIARLSTPGLITPLIIVDEYTDDPETP